MRATVDSDQANILKALNATYRIKFSATKNQFRTQIVNKDTGRVMHEAWDVEEAGSFKRAVEEVADKNDVDPATIKSSYDPAMGKAIQQLREELYDLRDLVGALIERTADSTPVTDEDIEENDGIEEDEAEN